MYRYAFGYKGELHRFTHTNKDAVLNLVIDFMRKNNINFNREDLIKAIERQSKIPDPGKKVTWADAVNGAKALLRYASGKSVPQEEVNRRSDICRNCPKISPISMCGSCGTAGKITRYLNNFMKLLSLKRAVTLEADVKYSYCSVCQCSLALMLVSSMDSFKQDQGRPDVCWLNPKSTNYKYE